MDESSHTSKLHSAFVERLRKVFVGRSKLRKECVKMMSDMSAGIIALVGKPGTGKSALLVSFLYMDSALFYYYYYLLLLLLCPPLQRRGGILFC